MPVPHEIQQFVLFVPVFEILKTLDNPISMGDLEELVIEKQQIPESVYTLISKTKYGSKEQTEFHFQMHWLKVKFNKFGYLENIRGKWKLTEAAKLLTNDEALAPFRDQHNQSSIQWKKNNHERENETQKKWREKNPEKVKERTKRWRENNLEKHRKASRESSKRRYEQKKAEKLAVQQENSNQQ